MAEYIERNMLLKMISHKPSSPTTDREDRLIDGFISAVKNCPAANVRPVVRGRWEKGTSENGVTTALFCSCCHYENRHWYEWSYCPHCGADMRETDDEKA